MIRKESLHIYDSIEYSRFLKLYSIYGGNLSESEFGDIFLDMSKNDYYDLKKRGSCKILKKELVEDSDIECMKVRLIKELGLKQLDEKKYDELEEIYNIAQSKLSLVHFAEKVLDVAQQTVSRTNIVKTRKATIFSKTNSDYFDVQKCDKILKSTLESIEKRKIEILELKDTIAKDRNLHMTDGINKADFEELYQIYGKEFAEIEFGEKILGINTSKIKSLLNDKIKDVKIWKEEIPTLDYLLKLREETIKEEKLHINEKINYDRFKEIYKRHSGILTEVDFALEILDIERARYNELKKGKSESQVISSIEVPEEFYIEAKKRIKLNESVYNGKLISDEEFFELYEKYGFVTNDLEFGEKVLEIEPEGLMALKRKDIKKTRILKNEENKKDTEYIKSLRKLVIRENRLHIEDPMTGSRFTKLYEKYGFGMSPQDFAFEILDIKDNKLNLILRDESQRTGILRNEKVSREEIKNLRKRMFRSGEHCKEDRIDYKEFLKLYSIYGGVLSENQFANKILFMSTERLSFIRTNPGETTEIFYRLKLSDAYIANLKAKVIKENLLYFKQPITLSFFNKLYDNSSTILSRRNFAEKILELNTDVYSALKRGERHISLILATSGTEENRTKFLEKQDEEIVEMLKKGYGYDEIEKSVNLSTKTLNRKIDNLYETKLDKKEIVCNYIYNKTKNNEEIDNNRIEESGIENRKIIDIKKRVENEKNLYSIKERADYIMYEVKDTPENEEILKQYINLCQKIYSKEPRSMPEEILETLQNCMEFLETDLENSLFFIKFCVDRMDYARANRLVTFNMQDDNLNVHSKRKLQEMRGMIRDASKRKDSIMKKRKIVSLDNKTDSIFKEQYAV